MRTRLTALLALALVVPSGAAAAASPEAPQPRVAATAPTARSYEASRLAR